MYKLMDMFKGPNIFIKNTSYKEIRTAAIYNLKWRTDLH